MAASQGVLGRERKGERRRLPAPDRSLVSRGVSRKSPAARGDSRSSFVLRPVPA